MLENLIENLDLADFLSPRSWMVYGFNRLVTSLEDHPFTKRCEKQTNKTKTKTKTDTETKTVMTISSYN